MLPSTDGEAPTLSEHQGEFVRLGDDAAAVLYPVWRKRHTDRNKLHKISSVNTFHMLCTPGVPHSLPLNFQPGQTCLTSNISQDQAG